MFFIIGFVIVFGSVLGGYLPHGDIAVLIQPFEVLIIVGGAIGAFIISNPKPVLSATAKSFGRVLKGSPYKKEAYVELLIDPAVLNFPARQVERHAGAGGSC